MMHSSHEFFNINDNNIKDQCMWITLHLLNLEFDHLHQYFNKVKLSNIGESEKCSGT